MPITIQRALWALLVTASYFILKNAISDWKYAYLVGPSIPMGAGIAADVVAVTLINAIVP